MIFQDWAINSGNIKGRVVLVLFRTASWLSRQPHLVQLILLPYAIAYKLGVEWLLGIELPRKLTLGANTRIYHGQGLVIHDSVVIGSGCVLRHNTTIGVAVTKKDYSGLGPRIGDCVDIGSNVVIVGDIQIGSHCTIGAGSVVVKSVSMGSVVVGNPARVVRNLNETELTKNLDI